MKGDKWKIALTLFLIAAAIYYLFPTVRYFLMDEADRQAMEAADPDALAALQKRSLKLGLDLQGGMRVVLEVDKSELDENAAKDARERALEIIRNRVDQFGVAEPIIQAQGSDRVVVELPALQDPERARNLIGKTALLEFKLVESPENTQILFQRLDQIAATLPLVRDVEQRLPDIEPTADPFKDPFADTTKDTVPTTAAKLDTTTDTSSVFDLDDTPATAALTRYLEYNGVSFNVLEEDYNKVNAIINSPEIQAAIPAENELAWGTRTEMINRRNVRQLYLLKSKTELTGAHLTDARPSYDQYHKPVVDFFLDRDGGNKFGMVTGPNIGKPLAILLDGRVESAPTIRSKIRDQGQITLGGQATFFDAKDLATVLRAGALPAPVKIVESSLIGPTLGKDSIDAGRRGLIVALILLLAFMFVYYRMSGLVADFVMLLNIFFLLAVMAGLGATLTLPGIAGIILTLGITVDASVLIFERIREELRSGKTVRAAIDAGYARAAIAIIDSNITILIATGVLYYFGTGPIKGFAVTLAVGIMISLYTALVVGRTIFHYRRRATTLSI